MNKVIIRPCVGDIFGNLQVIKDLGTDNSHHHHFRVKCLKCNKISDILKDTLLFKNDNGCKMCKKQKDYAGKRIGDFVVVKSTDKKSQTNNVIWQCKCVKCGNIHEFPSNQLSEKMIPKCKCFNYRKRTKSLLEQIF